MKKLASILFAMLFVSGVAFAAANPVGNISADARASQGEALSATATAGSVDLHHNSIYIENDGTDEVYLNFNDTVAADTDDFYLNSGEFITVRSAENRTFHKMGYVCASAETATVRYLAWD